MKVAIYTLGCKVNQYETNAMIQQFIENGDEVVGYEEYSDVYIINKNSHNIFYAQGIGIKENEITTFYYTDYTQPDETKIDIRYVDGILIPEGYYYIGKYKDNSGNERVVISVNKGEKIDNTSQVQYTWQKQVANIEEVPATVVISTNFGQDENTFIKSVNHYKA